MSVYCFGANSNKDVGIKLFKSEQDYYCNGTYSVSNVSKKATTVPLFIKGSSL